MPIPNDAYTYTLSGRIGKVVASCTEVARSIPGWAETAPIYTMHEALRGTAHDGGGATSQLLYRFWRHCP